MVYQRLVSEEDWKLFLNNVVEKLHLSQRIHEIGKIFLVLESVYSLKLGSHVHTAPVIMTHDEDDPEVIQGKIANPTSIGCICKMRVVELVWIFDNFCLRTFDFIYSPFKVKDHMSAFLESRKGDRGWFTLFRGLDLDKDSMHCPLTSIFFGSNNKCFRTLAMAPKNIHTTCPDCG
jgi:hypothetical protein